jgi:hypothetical protein
MLPGSAYGGTGTRPIRCPKSDKGDAVPLQSLRLEESPEDGGVEADRGLIAGAETGVPPNIVS